MEAQREGGAAGRVNLSELSGVIKVSLLLHCSVLGSDEGGY